MEGQLPVEGQPQVAERHSEVVQRQMEAQVIIDALDATRWNRKLAAARLNVDYKALLYKMKKLGIEANENASRRSQAVPA